MAAEAPVTGQQVGIETRVVGITYRRLRRVRPVEPGVVWSREVNLGPRKAGHEVIGIDRMQFEIAVTPEGGATISHTLRVTNNEFGEIARGLPNITPVPPERVHTVDIPHRRGSIFRRRLVPLAPAEESA